MRTSSEPARASWATCDTVADTFSVSVLVIDCTTTSGAAPPTIIFPIRTPTLFLSLFIFSCDVVMINTKVL